MTNKLPKRAWTWLEHVPSLFLAIVGVTILVIDVFFHDEVTETALYTNLPSYLRLAFVIFSTMGAVACFYGVLTKDARAEGAGIIAIGSAYLLDAIAIFSKGHGLFTGALLLAAGLYLWFQAFVLFPRVNYPNSDTDGLQDWGNERGINIPPKP